MSFLLLKIFNEAVKSKYQIQNHDTVGIITLYARACAVIESQGPGPFPIPATMSRTNEPATIDILTRPTFRSGPHDLLLGCGEPVDFKVTYSAPSSPLLRISLSRYKYLIDYRNPIISAYDRRFFLILLTRLFLSAQINNELRVTKSWNLSLFRLLQVECPIPNNPDGKIDTLYYLQLPDTSLFNTRDRLLL